jgi:hypothetical protein
MEENKLENIENSPSPALFFDFLPGECGSSLS